MDMSSTQVATRAWTCPAHRWSHGHGHVQHTGDHTFMDMSSTQVATRGHGHIQHTGDWIRIPDKNDEIAIKVENVFFDFEQSLQ